MIQGINVGPLAFSENPTPLYAIYAALLLANLVNLVLGLGLVHIARFAFSVPRRLLLASVLVVASAGSYALRGSLFDVQLVFVFGMLGLIHGALWLSHRAAVDRIHPDADSRGESAHRVAVGVHLRRPPAVCIPTTGFLVVERADRCRRGTARVAPLALAPPGAPWQRRVTQNHYIQGVNQ